MKSVVWLLQEAVDRSALGARKAAAAAASREAVLSTVRSILGFDPAVDQPLMEAGLDSLAAVELRNALAARFGLHQLPATLTFDHPSIAALTRYFDGEHPVVRTHSSCTSAAGTSTNAESQVIAKSWTGAASTALSVSLLSP